jgi:hypothetical protein
MPEHASRFIGLYDQQNENRIPDWGGDELFTRMPSRPAVDDAPAPRFQPKLELVDAPVERRRTPPGDEWRGPRDRRRGGSAEEAMRERAERLGLSVIEQHRPDAAQGWDDADGLGAPSDGSGAAAAPHRYDADGTGAAARDHADADGTGAARARIESSGSAAARAWEEAEASPAWERALDAPPERAANGRRTTVITGRPDRAPRPLSPGERRRPRRTPAEWIGSSPERIVAWAFILGLLLILIAISTADA